jgi:H-type lectin domain-containing protein
LASESEAGETEMKERSDTFYVASTSIHGVKGEKGGFDVPPGKRNETWTLDTDNPGDYLVTVHYPKDFENAPFENVPTVFAGITGIEFSSTDAGSTTLTRQVPPESVTEFTFDVQLSKTGSEIITRVDMEWAAFGE